MFISTGGFLLQLRDSVRGEPQLFSDWSSFKDCSSGWSGITCDDLGRVISMWEFNLWHHFGKPDYYRYHFNLVETFGIGFWRVPFHLQLDIFHSFGTCKFDLHFMCSKKPSASHYSIISFAFSFFRDLSNNILTGPIPEDVGKLVNLKKLYVYFVILEKICALTIKFKHQELESQFFDRRYPIFSRKCCQLMYSVCLHFNQESTIFTHFCIIGFVF